MNPNKQWRGETVGSDLLKNRGLTSMDATKTGEGSLSNRFRVSPEDYQIFSQQAGFRTDKITGELKSQTLNINETLGSMVGCTAKLIGELTGGDGQVAADHVIYLDKSARPVSWLVDEFWDDFTDAKKPETTYLAIDRNYWFHNVGLETDSRQYLVDASGEKRLARGSDFWEKFDALPKEEQRDYLARIRALYIEGGIANENINEILSTPTVLNGKNLVIVDEVARSGATQSIAVGLLKKAIPELNSVRSVVFWRDQPKVLDGKDGEIQMGNAPVWYPHDPNDWRGRGVKDINPAFYENQYKLNPNNKTRAERFGSIVLGEPLLNKEDEPGQLSWRLREEIERMRDDYDDGHILPTIFTDIREDIRDVMIERLEGYGVEFVPPEQAKWNPNAYIKLAAERDKR